MTDNEIIKALEWCTSGGNCMDCEEDKNRPRLSQTGCMAVQMRNALDLINRQKAEAEKQEAEIERLNYILQCYALEYGTVGDKERLLKVARAEAVKEFAEEVKRYYSEWCAMERMAHRQYKIVADYIDNLVKEFTEGKADEDK